MQDPIDKVINLKAEHISLVLYVNTGNTIMIVIKSHCAYLKRVMIEICVFTAINLCFYGCCVRMNKVNEFFFW